MLPAHLVVILVSLGTYAHVYVTAQTTDPSANLCNGGTTYEYDMGNDTTVTTLSPTLDPQKDNSTMRCKVVFKTSDHYLVALVQDNQFDLEQVGKVGYCRVNWTCVDGKGFCDDMEFNHLAVYIVPPRSVFSLYFNNNVLISKTGIDAFIGNFVNVNRTQRSSQGGVWSMSNFLTYITPIISDEHEDVYKEACNITTVP
ncbi:unnamed protein product [Lymnaea stagnalis]|uniref:Uncharacterized protein n=1 Tax=Lymnaea stagnalis TaxID=6523 RepID=A0AAV2ICU8_LYMST